MQKKKKNNNKIVWTADHRGKEARGGQGARAGEGKDCFKAHKFNDIKEVQMHLFPSGLIL